MVEVKPYEGVDELAFGMAEADVIATLGAPMRVSETRGGDKELQYHDRFVYLTGPERRFVEVVFLPSAEVSVAGIDVFGDSLSFSRLVQLDGSPLESVGTVVFLRLGIAVSGLHDGDEEQKSLAAFARGRWDSLKDRLKPFREYRDPLDD
jgi:hypothetical protein